MGDICNYQGNENAIISATDFCFKHDFRLEHNLIQVPNIKSGLEICYNPGK